LRCVFDTNVLVSALLLPDSKPRQALDLAIHKGKLPLSFATLAELYGALNRKQLRRYIDEEDARTFIAALTREAQSIDITVQIKACRDPRDDMFLELAISGGATQVVTGDKDLVTLNPLRGVQILPPH
jgi:uncharacterized protein